MSHNIDYQKRNWFGGMSEIVLIPISRGMAVKSHRGAITGMWTHEAAPKEEVWGMSLGAISLHVGFKASGYIGPARGWGGEGAEGLSPRSCPHLRLKRKESFRKVETESQSALRKEDTMRYLRI